MSPSHRTSLPKLCPVDDQTLRPAGFTTGRVHRCPQCAGVFVPADVLKEIRAFSAIELHKRDGNPDVQAALLSPARVACPNDARPLAALVYRGVEIDVCPECDGVWLDPGELEKIAGHAAAPEEAGRSSPDSRTEWMEEAVDTATGIDADALGGVVDFVADALGSLFDGISL